MNYPGVAAGDPKALAEMDATWAAGKVIGGHYAGMDLGLAFHAYVAGGAEDDHEGTRLEDAIVRARQGMKPMLRHSSAWQDVAAQVEAITKMGMDPRHFLLCTDDSHSETLVHEGHVNRAVRVAIAQGVPPLTAIQMATLNTAEHFGVGRLVGQISPGRFGDLLLMRDLPKVQPELVIANGKLIAQQGHSLVDLPAYPYPDWAIHSVHLGREMYASDFRLPAPGAGMALAHVIGIVENQAPNKHVRMQVPVVQGEILPDRSRDLAKIALIERHQGTGRIQVGLVHGFGFDVPCAVAVPVSSARMGLAAKAGLVCCQMSGCAGLPHQRPSRILKAVSSAETAGAATLFMATHMGIPVSTTHTITGAIIGVGATSKLSGIKWGVAGRIIWAWVLTIPASALVAAGCFYLMQLLHVGF